MRIMSKVMLIAPGHPDDRRWFPKSYAVHFMQPTTDVRWAATQDPLALDDGPRIGTATLRRWQSSGWRITLEFFVDDALSVGSADGPIIPTGYVLPGMIQGRTLEFLPLMHWRLNKRMDWWELWPAGGDEYVARATREFVNRMSEEQAQDIVIRGCGVPLPDEAWRPKPPPEVPMPRRTLRELLMILDSANDPDTSEES